VKEKVVPYEWKRATTTTKMKVAKVRFEPKTVHIKEQMSVSADIMNGCVMTID